MKKIILAALTIALSVNAYSQVWMSRNAGIRFFSETPVENIEAVSNTAMSAINTKTGKVYFKVGISSFEFKNSLMKEHFNENYLESDKFPSAEFDGIIDSLPDLSKDGTYDVTVKGKLTIHGVTKERTLRGTITCNKGTLNSSSKFTIRCVDHNIEIPTLVTQNIAEDLEVTVTSFYSPK